MPKVKFAFTGKNTRAAKVAQRQAARLVTNVTKETRAAIKAIVVRSIREQIPPYDAARLIRTTVGMTAQQAQGAMNYRAQLIESGLPIEKVNSLVDRYAERKVNARSKNIARTEIMDSLNEGSLAAWMQAKADGLLGDGATKEPVLTEDTDLCDICEALEGEEVPLNEPFSTGDMTPPFHPSCRCALIVNPGVGAGLADGEPEPEGPDPEAEVQAALQEATMSAAQAEAAAMFEAEVSAAQAAALQTEVAFAQAAALETQVALAQAEAVAIDAYINATKVPKGGLWDRPQLSDTELKQVQSKIADSAWYNSMSDAERGAVKAYMGSGYRAINETLRLGKASTGVARAGYSGDWALKRIAELDRALAKATLKETVVVYRSGNYKVGAKSMLDKGFTSTSLSRNVARGFAGNNKAFWEIEVPRGFRAAYLTNPNFASGSEWELLLGRGTKFEILSVENKFEYGQMRTYIKARATR